jgi:GntR family transcriptional regulator
MTISVNKMPLATWVALEEVKIMLNREMHVPLYIQLKEELTRKIKEGKWEIDMQIPTEIKLMEEYKVGRATVRQAISLLENQGYLYKRHGIGTFVGRIQPSLGFEPLISLSFSLKARGINQKNIIVDNRIIMPDKKLLNILKWKEMKDCYYIKRIRYAEDIAIAVEHSYFQEEYKEALSKYDLSGSVAKIIIEDLKLNIVKVNQIIELKVPTKQEIEELKLEKNTKLLNMQRWIYIEGVEEPFFYVNFIVSENIYSFPIENL